MFDEKIYKEKRLLMPRWKTYNQASTDQELTKFKNDLKSQNEFDNLIKKLKLKFTLHPNIETAFEIINLNAQFKESSFTELNKNAIDFILNNSLVSEKIKKDISNIDIKNLEDNNVGSINSISQYRKLLKAEPRDALAWCELSVAYLLEGELDKASKSIIIANQLQPDNRYITRCASYILFHLKDIERASWVVYKNSNFKVDPWILSIEISLSLAKNKTSKFIKNAHNLINENNRPLDITELSSILGTYYYFNSQNIKDIKKSKKAFKDSLKNPNENSLAQLKWHNIQPENLNNDLTFNKYKNTKSNFEFLTYEHYRLGEHIDCLDNAQYWMKYQPFSSKAAIIASYEACITEEYEKGISVCNDGIICNPNNFTLHNNKVFCLLNLNYIIEAEEEIKYIEKFKINNNLNKDTHYANKGLLAYKQGRYDEARNFYNICIENCKDKNNKELAKLMKLREELKITDQIVEKQNIKRKIEDLSLNKDKRLKLWVDNTRKLYKI